MRHANRTGTLILATSTVAMLLAGLVLTGSVSAVRSAGHTRIVVYTPFAVDGSLASGVSASRSARGYCWTGSDAARRSDAWRCFVGNYIHDPCYSGGDVRVVACPLDADGRKVLIIRLTSSLPRRLANPPLNTSRSLPAYVRLVTGKTCSFESGATATLGGRRLNYACGNGGWLVGEPNRTTPIWTILYLPSFKASQATAVGIATASW